MRFVWANADEGVKSYDAWQHLISLVDDSIHRSRASVIFFLQAMTRDGFLVDNERPGQGGYHSVWTPSPDVPCEESYMQTMAMQMVKVAGEILNVTFEIKQTPVA